MWVAMLSLEQMAVHVDEAPGIFTRESANILENGTWTDWKTIGIFSTAPEASSWATWFMNELQERYGRNGAGLKVFAKGLQTQ